MKEIESVLAELDVMRQEMERYAAFFDHAPDAYVITDADGAVREVNQAALEVLSGTREAIVGQPLSGLIRTASSARPIPLEDGGSGLCWLLRAR